jgi:exosortase/archaeosortase family protein
MRELPTSQGVAYLPDGAPELDLAYRPRQRSWWFQIVVFLGLFAAMQTGWDALRGSGIEHLVIDELTVKPAAWLVSTISPAVAVHASGTHLNAVGGGINVLNGCEGLEVMFLLVAAMLIAPIAPMWRVAGALGGSVVVYLCNQGRILALFYAVRYDHGLFDTLHGVVAPLLLVLVAAGFYVFWLGRHRADIPLDSPPQGSS